MDIFSDLGKFGFEDMKNTDLYNKQEKKVEKKPIPELKETDFLYDVEVTCPVCESTFSARAVKSSFYRYNHSKNESDFFMRYPSMSPYFYDVWICNSCGYASMKSDFNKIKKFQIEHVYNEITPRWRKKDYPLVYDVNIAIERYKLSLLNCTIMRSKSSKKAMNCLKLAWMYRILEDKTNEELFIKQAIIGFKDAYSNENLPIYQMNKFTVLYLIGELSRRIGDYSEALRNFSIVITAQHDNRKLKDRAIDQRDLIKEHLAKKPQEAIEATVKVEKKKGLFSRLF